MAKTFKVKGTVEIEDKGTAAVRRLEASLTSLGGFISNRLVVTLGDLERVFGTVIQLFTQGVTAAAEDEEAMDALASSLERAGPAAVALTDALVDQGAKIQLTTRFTANQVKEAQALLLLYNVAPESLQRATQATVDLAAALGIDLESAAKKVGGTITGTTKGLEKLVPSITKLSEEALKGGDGIDILANALEGRAVEAADNFNGKLTQLTAAWGEFQAAIAKGTVGSQEGQKALEGLTKATQGLADQVDTGDSFMSRWTATVINAATEAVSLVSTIIQLDRMYGNHVETIEAVTEATEAGNTALRTRATLEERNLRVNQQFADGQERVKQIAKELGVTLQSEVNDKLKKEAELWEELDRLARLGIDTTIAATEAQGELGAATNGVNAATQTEITLQRQLQQDLDQTRQRVILLARDFDNLARAAGREAATQAAVASGGRLILGGTRVRLAGGGSRLTSEPGLSNALNGGRFG